MLSGSLLRSTSTLVTALTAAALFSACQAEVQPPSEGDSRAAGEKYGKTIMDTVGRAASKEALAELCGQAIIDGKIVNPKTGRPGDETDLEVDAFIAGCKEAVGVK